VNKVDNESKQGKRAVQQPAANKPIFIFYYLVVFPFCQRSETPNIAYSLLNKTTVSAPTMSTSGFGFTSLTRTHPARFMIPSTISRVVRASSRPGLDRIELTQQPTAVFYVRQFEISKANKK